MTRETFQSQLEHDFGRPRGPAPFAFDIFDPLQKAADVEQEARKLGPRGVKRCAKTLFGGQNRVGKTLRPRGPRRGCRATTAIRARSGVGTAWYWSSP